MKLTIKDLQKMKYEYRLHGEVLAVILILESNQKALKPFVDMYDRHKSGHGLGAPCIEDLEIAKTNIIH